MGRGIKTLGLWVGLVGLCSGCSLLVRNTLDEKDKKAGNAASADAQQNGDGIVGPDLPTRGDAGPGQELGPPPMNEFIGPCKYAQLPLPVGGSGRYQLRSTVASDGTVHLAYLDGAGRLWHTFNGAPRGTEDSPGNALASAPQLVRDAGVLHFAIATRGQTALIAVFVGNEGHSPQLWVYSTEGGGSTTLVHDRLSQAVTDVEPNDLEAVVAGEWLLVLFTGERGALLGAVPWAQPGDQRVVNLSFSPPSTTGAPSRTRYPRLAAAHQRDDAAQPFVLSFFADAASGGRRWAGQGQASSLDSLVVAAVPGLDPDPRNEPAPLVLAMGADSLVHYAYVRHRPGYRPATTLMYGELRALSDGLNPQRLMAGVDPESLSIGLLDESASYPNGGGMPERPIIAYRAEASGQLHWQIVPTGPDEEAADLLPPYAGLPMDQATFVLPSGNASGAMPPQLQFIADSPAGKTVTYGWCSLAPPFCDASSAGPQQLGRRDYGEACEGDNLAEIGCGSLFGPEFNGELACHAGCGPLDSRDCGLLAHFTFDDPMDLTSRHWSSRRGEARAVCSSSNCPTDDESRNSPLPHRPFIGFNGGAQLKVPLVGELTQVGNDSFTLGFLFNYSPGGATIFVVGTNEDRSTWLSCAILPGNPDELVCRVRADGSVQELRHALQGGRAWWHVSLRFFWDPTSLSSAKGTLRLYVDGKLATGADGIASPSIRINEHPLAGADALYFGAPVTTATSVPLSGGIDEITVHSRALRANEQALYGLAPMQPACWADHECGSGHCSDERRCLLPNP